MTSPDQNESRRILRGRKSLNRDLLQQSAAGRIIDVDDPDVGIKRTLLGEKRVYLGLSLRLAVEERQPSLAADFVVGRSGRRAEEL